MDILGIGPMEFLMIAFIGLLVLGPNRLVEMARKVGKMWRDFQRGWQNTVQEFTLEGDLRRDERPPVPAPEGQLPYKTGEQQPTTATSETKTDPPVEKVG